MPLPRSRRVPPSPALLLARWWRVAIGGAWLVAVGALTLRAEEPLAPGAPEIAGLCLICGVRGTADAVLNVVLFVPLGLIFGGRRRGLWKAIGSGLVVASLIEITQMTLPGRYAGPADVLWNTAGAALGTVVYAMLRQAVIGRARPGAAAWGAVIAVALLAAGALMTPHRTDDRYWGQWTPDLGSMPQYRGQVLGAELSGRPMPSWRIDHPGPHRSLLTGDWRLRGRIVVGPPPAAVSPILSVYDEQEREIVLLGAHGNDLVFRERTLGTRLRFDMPDVRVAEAFERYAPGDTTSIEVSREAGTTCLRAGSAERCGVGVTPGRTWGLLLYLEGPGEPVRDLIDLLWIALLFVPVGLFGRSGGDVAGGAVLGVVGMTATTVLTPLIAGRGYQLLACLLGIALGRSVVLALRGIARSAGQSTAAASMTSNV